MFVADNHVYPLSYNPRSENYSEHLFSWAATIQNELGTVNHTNTGLIFWHRGVWQCPSAITPATLPRQQEISEYLNYLSYGYNGFGLSVPTDTNTLGLTRHYIWNGLRSGPPVSESEIASPSDMMAIGDGFWNVNGIIHDGSMTLWRTYSAENTVGLFGGTKQSYARHQGKANVVFCDGHVESPTLQFLFEDTSDDALVRWNRDHLPHREKLSP